MKKLICMMLLVFIPSISAAVSFDCSKFNTGVYKMICDSPELSKLDDELSRLYNLANNTYGNDREFKESVKETLRVRGGCNNEACLIDWYKSAINLYQQLEIDVNVNPVVPQASCWKNYAGWSNCFSNDQKLSATVTTDSNGYFLIYFSSLGGMSYGNCVGYGAISQIASVEFNGVLVRMVSACNSGNIVHMPATFDGSQYVLNQLISKNELMLKNTQGHVFAVFSAIGFKKSLDQIKQNRGGI